MDQTARIEALKTAWEAGDADTALTHLDVLIDEDPSQRRWPFDKGIVLEGLGDIEGAMTAYTEAIRRDPEYVDALVNLARWNDETGQFDTALELYDRALVLDPKESVGWGNRGNTLLNLERFEDALESFEKAIALDDNPSPLRGRQSALAALGRVDECNAVRPEGTPADRGELREYSVDIDGKPLVARFFVGRHTRPEWLVDHAQMLLDYCASVKDTPPGIADGVRIQFGWTPLLVRERNGTLVLCEPDPSDPFGRVVWDVGFTLQTSLMHAMNTTMLDLEPVDCRMADIVAVDPDVIHEPVVAMRRLHETDEHGFSGWTIGHPDDAVWQQRMDELRPMRSGTLIQVRHPLIKALLLPPGFKATFEQHAMVSCLDPDGKELLDFGE